MSRSRIRESQADRSLASAADLAAGYKTYAALTGGVVTSAAPVPLSSVSSIFITGVDLTTLEIQEDDVLQLSGSGANNGDYRVSAVLSSTVIQIKATLPTTTFAGTADIYYKEGSRYVGVNDAAWTWFSGADLQASLDSVDSAIQSARDLVPSRLSEQSVGDDFLPAVLMNGDGLVQQNLGGVPGRFWLPAGNATTITAVGSAAPTASGTATTRTVAVTSIYTMQRRVGYVSAGTAGSASGARLAALQYALGSVTGGGFLAVYRFGVSDAAAVAQARNFVGMIGQTTAIGNVNPSTLVNCIGLASNSGDADFSIMHNDGAGVATTVPLGALFPANTRNTDVYRLTLFAPPGAGTVKYRVDRENTGDFVVGVLSTNLPAGLLAPQLWRNNGTNALAVGLDLLSFGVV